MLRLLLRGGSLKRLTRGIPIVGALLVAEVAAMAWAHLAKLNPTQRRRLLTLLAQSRGRSGSLTENEREELAFLFAILEPRLFLGSAAKRLSPVPLPQRLLYGPRDSRS